MLEHKPQVSPVFVNYHQVSFEGYKTPLIDVAVAVGKVVSNANVDTIQLTRNGWQVYVKTEKDQAVLVATGLDLASKHISLKTRSFQAAQNAKIIIKDLPLNEVSNEEVLEAFKKLAPVTSMVKYSNIWIDGHHMHIQNGDCFLYVVEEHILNLPATLMVRDMKACVIRPVVYAKCSR